MQWHPPDQQGTSVGLGGEFQVAAKTPGTFTHVSKPVAAEHLGGYAHPVVGDRQGDVFVDHDGDAHVACVGVPGDVRQRLAQHRYELIGDALVDGVDRTLELQAWLELETICRLSERGQKAAAQAGGLRSPPCREKTASRSSLIVWSRPSIVDWIRGLA